MIRFIPFILMLLLLVVPGCGGGTGGLQLEVIPPQTVEYFGLGPFLLGKEIVAVEPFISGGQPDNWTVSPEFPAGVLLNPETGVISGVPEEVHSPTPHTIMAQNSSGHFVITVMISVLPTTPCGLSYETESIQVILGEPIGPFIPLYGCGPVQLWTIIPQLPEGLLFDSSTGSISGVAQVTQPMSDYLVSGFNQFGSASTILALEVIGPPPCQLTYEVETVSLSQGQTLVPLLPVVGCGDVTIYSIDPALPVGLSLNVSNGVLSGEAGGVHPLTHHEIMASNPAGFTSFTISIEVLVESPCNLQYPESEITLTVGDVLADGFLPTSECGFISQYSVDPALPEGLLLNTETGEVSGTVLEEQSATDHVIRASNSTGFAEFLLGLEVHPEPPCDYVYPVNSLDLEVGTPLQVLTPQIACGLPTMFESLPALPAGIQLDTQTGVISGQPLETSNGMVFTFIASNISGVSTTTLEIQVLPEPPCDFQYPSDQIQLTVGHSLSPLVPSNGCGSPTGYTALPPLPAGLILEVTTGIISGIPQFVGGPTSHIILAGNISGDVSFLIEIEVVEDAPCDLSYPVLNLTLETGQEVGPLNPLVGCGVPTEWVVSPSLPSGLSLDQMTGTIFGTVQETQVTSSYQIQASNGAGSTYFTLEIEIHHPAPCGLTYSSSLIELFSGEDLAPMIPNVGCGPVEEYRIDPQLPEGLTLDPILGILQGTAQGESPIIEYVISALNPTGASNFPVLISIFGAAPCDLQYPDAVIAAPVGTLIDPQVPVVDCGVVSTWSIEPPLPGGMEFDTTSGVISGEILSETESHHTVTASNGFGDVQFELTLICRLIYDYRGSELVVPYSIADGVGSGSFTLTAQESELNPGYPTSLSGISMAIQYDSNLLQFIDAVQTPETSALNGGEGPDFWAINPIDGGVLIGMLVSFSFVDSLILTDETPIVNLSLQTQPEAFIGDSVGISGQLIWGNPTTIPLDNLIVIDGANSSIPVMESVPFLIQPQ